VPAARLLVDLEMVQADQVDGHAVDAVHDPPGKAVL
jgi:hypothetical protein